MSRRDSLSRFVLPFVGAAVLTAGTLLLQMGRRPASTPATGRSERPTGRAVPEKEARADLPAVADPTSDDTLLRRLRASGL